MIWSVSTLLRRNGSAVPVWVSNLSIRVSLKIGRSTEVSGDRRSRRHRRRDQVGPPTLALAPLEIAVRRRRRPLAGRKLIRVHAQTHGAAGSPPFGSGLLEDDIQ